MSFPLGMRTIVAQKTRFVNHKFPGRDSARKWNVSKHCYLNFRAPTPTQLFTENILRSSTRTQNCGRILEWVIKFVSLTRFWEVDIYFVQTVISDWNMRLIKSHFQKRNVYFVAFNLRNTVMIIKKFLRILGGGPKRKCMEESSK